MSSLGCERSNCLHTSLYPNYSPRYLDVGDVGHIAESVKTPIEIILTAYSNLDPRSKAFYDSQASLSFFSSRSASDKNKTRPCIIVNSLEGENQTEGLSIALMATFEGTHISALPYVYQHFALPISPHYAIDANSATHMHSSPSDWPKHNNWIIAWIFQSAHPVGGRWRKKTSPDFRYFGNKDMALFEKECETRKQQWRTLCLDKVKAQHYADEYRAHVRNHRAASSMSSNMSWSSICSQTTYLSSICGRRSSVWTDLESICEEPSTHEVCDAVSICDELASSVIAERQPSSFIATLSGQMHNGAKNVPQSLHGALKMRSDMSIRSRRKHAHEVSSIMSGASVRSGTECSNGSSISLNSRRLHWMNKGAFGGHH